jgi:hypothetical protein
MQMNNLNRGTGEDERGGNVNCLVYKDVRGGNVNCLVYKAKELARQPIILERPDIPVAQPAKPIDFTSVKVMNSSQTELQSLNISTDFIIHAFQSIKSLAVLNTRRFNHTLPAGMAQFEKHTNTFAKMLTHCLSLFLRHKVPSERSSSGLEVFARTSPQNCFCNANV